MTGTPYNALGTTPLIPIQPQEGKRIEVGKHYFALQIKSAQAVYKSSIWERARSLIVTSRLNLNYKPFEGQPLLALRRSIEIQGGKAIQLGLSPNLINLIPALMDNVSVSLEFLLDRKNRLQQLAGLINDDSFLTAVSLAPGAAVAAKTLGGLAHKLLTTFFSDEEPKPILQFTGDFNFASAEFDEGYYAVLGSCDDSKPLPRPLPNLSVMNDDLLADGRPVTQWSYILLKLFQIEARTRDRGKGEPWHDTLHLAENIAEDVANAPLIAEDQREGKWRECHDKLKDMRVLLQADPNYLPWEAADITRAAFKNCREQIFGKAPERLSFTGRTDTALLSLNREHLDFLGLTFEEELQASFQSYAEKVARSRQIMKEAGIE